jgi:hypothetical protein
MQTPYAGTAGTFCEKHDDFMFHIVDSTFIRSNVPAVPAYGVCIAKLLH